MPSLVKTIVHKKNHESKSGKKYRRVMRRPRSFKVLERIYLKAIDPFLEGAKRIIDRRLVPKIDYLVRLRDATRPKSDSIRTDAWVDQFEAIMGEVVVEYFNVYNAYLFRRTAQDQARRINFENSKDFKKAFTSATGIEPIALETWLVEEMKAFVSANVALIRSIPEQYFSQIESKVSSMIRQGKMTDDITKEIEKRYNVAENRAALIARDQTSKFNGNLTMLRQQDIGIVKYEWATSVDERVRGNPGGKFPNAKPSHFAREGKIFEWKSPPSDGHPGQAINCRCVALGVIE